MIWKAACEELRPQAMADAGEGEALASKTLQHVAREALWHLRGARVALKIEHLEGLDKTSLSQVHHRGAGRQAMADTGAVEGSSRWVLRDVDHNVIDGLLQLAGAHHVLASLPLFVEKSHHDLGHHKVQDALHSLSGAQSPQRSLQLVPRLQVCTDAQPLSPQDELLLPGCFIVGRRLATTLCLVLLRRTGSEDNPADMSQHVGSCSSLLLKHHQYTVHRYRLQFAEA